MTENNTTSWWSATYPQRYYAYSNTEYLLGGYPTPGYVDVAMFAALPTWLPAASDMIALTEAAWNARSSSVNQIVKDTEVQTYNAPVVVVPLKTQAATAQAWIQQQANLAAAMGEVFTADMKAYVSAISAIASGADTTSTALPAQPADVMAASAATTATG
ncbi:hypothetical protein JK165_12620 [Acetobacter okinawensis]|uniref:hypothetical protein n=1 Tax=Acetobacter okinawensis TaxID=1076594 RepID=UPI001BA632DA|nr:hypothetical protein [Acetobacter okinawensis]MBS0966919.1 hypothetical protein [Acetobacter okinawensis]